MNRTLTAAAALAAGLGAAGLANAQSSMSPSTAPSTTSPSPSTTSPSMTGPGGTQHPATMSPSTTGTYGTRQPQAQTTEPGQMNQPSQMNQPTQALSQPAQQMSVQEAQQQLQAAGLYRGAVDGVMGPQTESALAQFQREQGLPRTSQLDQQTMNRLMSPSGGAPGATMGTTSQPGMTGAGATTGVAPSSNGMNPTTTGGSYNR